MGVIKRFEERYINASPFTKKEINNINTFCREKWLLHKYKYKMQLVIHVHFVKQVKRGNTAAFH